jgi:hypothetical protein
MTKYKEYFLKMIEENKTVFDNFKKLHALYEQDESKWQNKLNEDGEVVMDIVREYENRLCSNTERGVYNKFSSGLSEKFQAEVRKTFPKIDHIGLKIEQVKPPEAFTLRKIKLN